MTDGPHERQLTFPEAGEGSDDTADGPGRSRPRPRTGLSRGWLFVLWLLLIGWIGLGYFLIPWDRTMEDPDAPALPPEETDLLMLVMRGEDPDPPALALVVRSPSVSRVILLPATTVVEMPGAGPRTLTDALAEGGVEGLVTSVANALSSEVPDAFVGDAAAVRQVVDALGGLEVDVPRTVEVQEEGVIRTLFRAGPATLSGEEFVRFATARLAEEGELDRVARQDSAWRALLARLGADAPGQLAGWLEAPEGAGVRDRLLDAAQAQERHFTTLPVRRVGVTGADLYRLDEEEMGAVHEALGTARTVEERDGRRIRLLVGTDAPVGPAVARRLVEAGYVIVLTGRAEEGYEETRVVIAENTPELRERAEELTELLGTGRLGVFRRPQTVFDVTLVVGEDWAVAHGFVEPEAEPEAEPEG